MTRLLILLFLSAIFISLTDRHPIPTAQTDNGHFVEINGKKQFYLNKGMGNPVIVFVTGIGGSLGDFSKIQNKISKTTRTVSYDRAGIGKSDPTNNEKNLDNLSNELKEFLSKVGVDKPCILVGHSRGGLLVRYFANKYSDKVYGLILIDPSTIPEIKWKKRLLRTETEKIKFDSLNKAFYSDSADFSLTVKNELKNFHTSDSAFIKDKNFSDTIPITIIASSKITKDKYSKEDNDIKIELLKNYLKKAPQIKLIFTDKSGHYIHHEQPKLIINEIASMTQKIKSIQ